MNTQITTLKVKTLVIAVGLSMASLAQAQSSNEVAQLRQEVQELKSLLEQYNQQQQKQTVELQVAQTQVQTQIVAQERQSDSEKKGLAFTKGGAELSIYGNVRADASYQAKGGSDARLYNQINTVPLGGSKDSNDRLKSTLAATRLGLDFKTATQAGDVAGKLEVDFLGANDALRIRHAYLTYGDWLIGQTWSNFAVPDYMPETIDALGYVGGSVKRNPQVRYTTKFNAKTNLVMALEDPKDASSNMRLPALSARLNHKFADAGTFSLRTMVNEKKTTEDKETAWGVGLGAKYDLTPKTTLKADYYHVKGDSSFVAWTNPGFAVDANKNIVGTNKFDSITVGITQQFNTQWRGTLGYGYMKADDNQRYIDTLKDKANKNLWQAWGNLFYSPTKPISLGLEYVYGERETFVAAPNGSKTGEDNRVSAVAIYNF
ncbi:DcaP family trimeric outer membrane transporter [Acinetobacter sp. ANC 4648]|uniref:DcaP family trimeric outer membrane transporter n=1 Tax=Acinetobacter sp. ANC 4648 TaxID=1977875 RepID=UPI000A33708B|nr:DcaP family trimeric outer membrane transporter [Acinetobacter sp. ANC 4648]OTG82437.1 hypothetical protein B9T27_09415 [Acinetobacter sp. ANC 4648]